MKLSNSVSLSVYGFVVVAMLGGCGAIGTAGSLGAAGPMTQPMLERRPLTPLRIVLGGDTSITGNSFHRLSWIASQAKESDLLYVSDAGAATVDIFSYPSGTLLGQITGFGEPFGECVDAAQNLWVTDFAKSKIFEYARGSAIPINTLRDPGYKPYGCSVDPTTGNLAVTNTTPLGGQSGSGGVAIYTRAKGMAKIYSSPSIKYPFLCGYDNRGNLFVDGKSSVSPKGAFQFVELPKGDNTFLRITLNRKIGVSGGVLWDGNSVTVGDQSTDIVHRFAIGGSVGTEVQSTTLRGAVDVTQYWIQGKVVIGPDIGHGSRGAVGFWNYPKGGWAWRFVDANDIFETPVGSAVSLVKP